MIDARSSMIEMLTSTWKRLLKLPSVGLDDNFFERGGTPALAADLFREITDKCDRPLPPVMIYQAPTIAALASLLANTAQPPQCPPVLLMRSGVGNPPVFLAHGMRADALQLFHVAKHIQVRNPIYGTQAQGIDGVKEPLDRVEDMAALYLHAISAVQPQGPYLLVGYSFGGLVMMEVAHRLRAEGQQIALLMMLDSYPHRQRLSPGQQFPLFARSATRRLSSLARNLREPGDNRLATSENKQPNLSLDSAQRVYSGELLAWKRYRPRFYPGKINFVKAEILSYYPADPSKVWAYLVKEFMLESAPGDHIEMIATHYRTLADLITQHIIRVLGEEVRTSNL